MMIWYMDIVWNDHHNKVIIISQNYHCVCVCGFEGEGVGGREHFFLRHCLPKDKYWFSPIISLASRKTSIFFYSIDDKNSHFLCSDLESKEDFLKVTHYFSDAHKASTSTSALCKGHLSCCSFLSPTVMHYLWFSSTSIWKHDRMPLFPGLFS